MSNTHDDECESATHPDARYSHCRCAERAGANLPTPFCPYGREPCTSGCLGKWRACVDND